MSSYLESVLINTYNPDFQLRTEAENALNQFILSSGACYQLLQVVGNKSVDRNIRLAAEIMFKNRLRGFWTCTDGLSMTEEEKTMVKQTIFDTLLNEDDNSIKGLLADNIRTICEFEYPDKWPEIIQRILDQIPTSNPQKIYNSLLALRKIIKRYEYKPKEERAIMNDIIQRSFPLLQQIMTVLLENNTIEAAQVMRICLKIFWSATMYVLPEVNGVDVNLWFHALGYLLQKPLHEAHEGIEPLHQPVSIEQRIHWPWWKLKKWTARILTQFIQRYGNPRYAATEYKEFAEFFRANTSVTLLGPVMNTLALKSQGKFVTDDVYRMCMTFITSSIEMSPTYKALKPHLDFILFHVIFPTLALTPMEIELFQEDPQEFIRKVHDPFEDLLDLRVTATSLLQMLCRYREKDILPLFMPFLQNALVEYMNAPPEKKNYLQKDAILVAIAALIKVLKDSKTYSKHLPVFLTQHIIPEFHNPINYIRARSYWIIDYFDNEDYSDPVILKSVTEGLLHGLTDTSVVVQSAAACSIRRLIETEGTKDLLRPVLPQLIAQYFKIMQEAENDAVLTSLQAIVDTYGVEISPLAITMVEQLIECFKHFANIGQGDDDAAFSATQSLDTILAVIDAVESIPEIITALEPKLLPLIQFLLSEHDNAFEYLEHCLSIVSYFTYCNETISPAVWGVCGTILYAFHTWAYDFIRDVSVPIINYMSKGITVFLQGVYNGVPFPKLLLDTIQKAFETDLSQLDYDAKTGAAMLNCFITCCRYYAPGSIDTIFPDIVNMIVKRLAVSQSKDSKIRILECLFSCLYYNPVLTLSIMEQTINTSGINTIFNLIFELLSDMTRDLTQRYIVLSFINLLNMNNMEVLPDMIKQNINSMFVQILREIQLIEENVIKERERAERGETGEEGDDEDEDFAFDVEDDDEEDDGDDDGIEIDDDDDDDDDEEADGNNKTGMKKKKAQKIINSATRLAGLSVPDGGFNDDEDCLNAEDEAYREFLENMETREKKKSSNNSGGGGGGGGGRQLYRDGKLVGGGDDDGDEYDEDDDDEDDEDMDDDYAITLPIENMDMSSYFIDAMNALTTTNPMLSQQLQSMLNDEDKQRLQTIIQTVHERKNAVTQQTSS